VTPVVIPYASDSNSSDYSSIEPNANEPNNNNLDSWIGKYSFFEFVPPHEVIGSSMMWNYDIYLYEMDNLYYALVFIDGFQTCVRAKATVVGNDESINVVFELYLPGNLYEANRKGDILLTLERSDDEMLTYWGIIEAVVSDNQVSGEVYFVKQS
jgi:hypothetical protein